MCGEEKENKSCCLYNLLKEILLLQDRDIDNCCVGGCDKPFLGPNPSCVCYNTRPLNFYNCQTGELWSINYLNNGVEQTSTVFRIEELDECCCTCRILIDNTNQTYTATNQFFTIDLNCVSAVQCLPDVYVEIC